MINKVTYYKCGYCDGEHDSEEEAIKCIESHPIIFVIEEFTGGYDCYGSTYTDWKETDIVFKTYTKAIKYISNNVCLRIKYKELRD